MRLTGGTARSKVWNQIFANVLQAPIVGVDCEETGALGKYEEWTLVNNILMEYWEKKKSL